MMILNEKYFRTWIIKKIKVYPKYFTDCRIKEKLGVWMIYLF